MSQPVICVLGAAADYGWAHLPPKYGGGFAGNHFRAVEGGPFTVEMAPTCFLWLARRRNETWG